MATELSFAGVGFALDTPEVIDVVESRISLADLRDLLPIRPWTYPALYDSALPRWADGPPPRLGTYFYPGGASRWAMFYGLATGTQVSQMAAAAFSATGPVRQTFVMQADPSSGDTLSQGGISTPMYMLPARPLFVVDGSIDDLYLVVLVDERYFWQFKDAGVFVTGPMSTWDLGVQSLADSLGAPITFDDAPSVYGKPPEDSALFSNYENAAALMDACAWNTGRVLVRNWDATYKLQTPVDAEGASQANRTADGANLAGGDPLAASSAAAAAIAAVLPSKVTVTFPKFVTNGTFVDARDARDFKKPSYGSVYSKTIPLSATTYAGYVGNGSTKTIHDTARAYYPTAGTPPPGSPTNQSLLDALALQLAQDYYDSIFAGVDEVYPGIRDWVPEGANDLIFTYRGGACWTRVLRRPWNFGVSEMQHETDYALMGTEPPSLALLLVTSQTKVHGCYPCTIESVSDTDPPTTTTGGTAALLFSPDGETLSLAYYYGVATGFTLGSNLEVYSVFDRGYDRVQSYTIAAAPRPAINFTDLILTSGVWSLIDNGGNHSTDVSILHSPGTGNKLVDIDRKINTISPLEGGGSLAGDLTLSIAQDPTTPVPWNPWEPGFPAPWNPFNPGFPILNPWIPQFPGAPGNPVVLNPFPPGGLPWNPVLHNPPGFPIILNPPGGGGVILNGPILIGPPAGGGPALLMPPEPPNVFWSGPPNETDLPAPPAWRKIVAEDLKMFTAGDIVTRDSGLGNFLVVVPAGANYQYLTADNNVGEGLRYRTLITLGTIGTRPTVGPANYQTLYWATDQSMLYVSTPGGWENIGLPLPMTTFGDMIYMDSSGLPDVVTPNTTTTLNLLTQTGAGGGVSAAPVWEDAATALGTQTVTVVTNVCPIYPNAPVQTVVANAGNVAAVPTDVPLPVLQVTSAVARVSA